MDPSATDAPPTHQNAQNETQASSATDEATKAQQHQQTTLDQFEAEQDHEQDVISDEENPNSQKSEQEESPSQQSQESNENKVQETVVIQPTQSSLPNEDSNLSSPSTKLQEQKIDLTLTQAAPKTEGMQERIETPAKVLETISPTLTSQVITELKTQKHSQSAQIVNLPAKQVLVTSIAPEKKIQFQSELIKPPIQVVSLKTNNENKPNNNNHHIQEERSLSQQGQASESETQQVDDDLTSKENVTVSRDGAEAGSSVAQTEDIPSEEPEGPLPEQIIKLAEKERVGDIYSHFLSYTVMHLKHSRAHSSLIQGIYDELELKRSEKGRILLNVTEYLNAYSEFCLSFHQKSYKFIKTESFGASKIPYLNFYEELKGSIDDLVSLRKQAGNGMNRVADFINKSSLKTLNKIIDDYLHNIGKAQRKCIELKSAFFEKEEQLRKRISRVAKVCEKEGYSSPDSDVFVELYKYIRTQQELKVALAGWGKGLIDLRRVFIQSEVVLIEQMNGIYGDLRACLSGIYEWLGEADKKKTQAFLTAVTKQIKQGFVWTKVCAVHDMDYVKFALESKGQGKREINEAGMLKFLQAGYFEALTGKASQTLQGTSRRSFQAAETDIELIHTVSGSLILFDYRSTDMREKFIIKNITLKIVADKTVEINEIVKGIIFNSSKTVRVVLKTHQIAQQLLCFIEETMKIS